jgi:hypothetical protein
MVTLTIDPDVFALPVGSEKEKSPSGGVVVIPPQPVRRRSLLDIADDIAALDDLLEECGGDITEIEKTVDGWFAELGIERDRKLDGYGSLIAELTNRAEVRETRAAQMIELARLDKKKVEFLKARLLQFFQANKIERVDTERFRFTRCKNGGAQPVWIDEAKNLPDEYRRTVIKYKPEKEKIVKALQAAGGELPFAKLQPRGEHIRIK